MLTNALFFHDPDKADGYLSNWYQVNFAINGIVFSSVEQYMMYEKAMLFGDTAVAEEIMKNHEPNEIKQLGRQVKNYNDVVWKGMCQIIVYRGILEKFRQNEALKAQLIATGDRILVKCVTDDKVWGNGTELDEDERLDMSRWTGDNFLGFTLMCVRDALR